MKGKKTYIFAALIGGCAAASFLGILSHDTCSQLAEVFGAGGLASLRAAIANQ